MIISNKSKNNLCFLFLKNISFSFTDFKLSILRNSIKINEPTDALRKDVILTIKKSSTSKSDETLKATKKMKGIRNDAAMSLK